MTLEQKIARLFRMDDTARRRHANPWSGYTRFFMIPLIALAFWSRVWLGWWALAPIILVLIWVWLNPRVFPEPNSTDNWASRAVLGEWVWMNRKSVPVPKHHLVMPNVLSAVSAAGAVPFVLGLLLLDIWPTVAGGIIVFISKLWFADRMVWLYGDMKDATPEYRSWLY
jgi:hypothetical protein